MLTQNLLTFSPLALLCVQLLIKQFILLVKMGKLLPTENVKIPEHANTREKLSLTLLSLSLDEHFSFFRSREMKISCSKKLSEHFLCVGGC